jgi:hypothetical protein
VAGLGAIYLPVVIWPVGSSPLSVLRMPPGAHGLSPSCPGLSVEKAQELTISLALVVGQEVGGKLVRALSCGGRRGGLRDKEVASLFLCSPIIPVPSQLDSSSMGALFPRGLTCPVCSLNKHE